MADFPHMDFNALCENTLEAWPLSNATRDPSCSAHTVWTAHNQPRWVPGHSLCGRTQDLGHGAGRGTACPSPGLRPCRRNVQHDVSDVFPDSSEAAMSPTQHKSSPSPLWCSGRFPSRWRAVPGPALSRRPSWGWRQRTRPLLIRADPRPPDWEAASPVLSPQETSPSPASAESLRWACAHPAGCS